MINRVKEKIYNKIFNRRIKDIRKTPAVNYQHRGDVKIVTLLQHSAIDMYLLAIKSFLTYLGFGEVHVLNDGSLTKDDLAILHQHIPNLVVNNISNIDTGDCPKGNCWERLFYIIGLTENSYVIQLDSDTISISPMPEIYFAIENQRSFTVGCPVWSAPVDVNYLKNIIYTDRPEHIQPTTERIMSRLSFFQNNPLYIRGSAAFAGFAKQQITLDTLYDFSNQVVKEIGLEKWFSWGSEQVASNVMVAQSKHPIVLPWPRYQNYKFPVHYKDSVPSTALIHFIGTNRFSDRLYEKLAVDLVKKLNNTRAPKC